MVCLSLLNLSLLNLIYYGFLLKIPPEQHEVIVGSLLGDMSAVKPNFCHYKSFYVQRIICHTENTAMLELADKCDLGSRG